jgi:hypothetical protein
VSTQGPAKCKRGVGLCTSAFIEQGARTVYNGRSDGRCIHQFVRAVGGPEWLSSGVVQNRAAIDAPSAPPSYTGPGDINGVAKKERD